jgi:hypothetical protein
MVAAMPAAVMPVPMTVSVTPAHLFGLQTIHLVLADISGKSVLVRGRQPPVLRERMRRKRRGMRTGRQRRGAGCKSKGEFQKVAAFHDISLFAAVK